MTRQTRAAGFTLLEMSVVLVLIGLILSMGLVILTASVQSVQFNTTVAEMDAIENALLNFSAANTRIPCPSDLTLTTASADYGLEAGADSTSTIGVGTGSCYSAGACPGASCMLPKANFSAANGQVEGGVPTRALQLPDSYMYDGWGHRFRYAVDPTATATSALPVQQGAAWCGDPITVNDASGAARSTNAIYALISHGANGHGAYTSNGVALNASSVNPSEQINCHCDNTGASGGYPLTNYQPSGTATGLTTPTYVQMMPTIDTTNALDNFDDIVAYKEAWQLQSRNFPLTSTAGKAAPACIYVMKNDGGAHIVQYNSAGTLLNTVSCYHAVPAPVGTLVTTGQITLGQNGNLWAADQSAGRVNEFALSPGSNANTNCPGTYGSYINRYGSWGASPAVLGRFSNSGSVAVDMYGNIWMGDPGGARIQMLNVSTGTFVGQVGCDGTTSCTTSTSADGQLNPAAGGSYPIAFDKNNNLWVGDSVTNLRVEEFTINYSNVTGGTNPGKNMGTWVQTIGGGNGCAGGYVNATTCSTVNGNATCCAPNAASCTCAGSTGMGNFNGISGIAIDPDGTSVWVSDGNTDRIEKFVISGATSTLVQEIGGGLGASCPAAYGCTTTPAGGANCNLPCTSTTSCYCSGGAANGQFNAVKDIAFDPQGNLWVVDTNNNRVQEINPAIAGINATGGYINGVTGSLGYIGSFSVPGANAAFHIAISR